MRDAILFDFDRTLFDTSLFGREISEKIEKLLNIPPGLFNNIKKQYQSKLLNPTDFDPDDFLLLLSKESSVSLQDLKKTFFKDSQCYKSAVYSEVIDVLKKLRKQSELGIYSEGVIDWQMLKLRNSGLIKFFDPKLIFIFRRKTLPEALAKLPKDCVIVEDNLQVIDELSQNKFNSIWINRKDASLTENVRTIHTLDELIIKFMI